MSRDPKNALRRIRTLDPVDNYLEIYSHLVLQDAAATMAAGLNLAFYRSFAAPAIAPVLVGTREALDHPRKRAEDSAILIFEMVMHGFDHPRGRKALARMNRIHAAFPIDNAHYLYVLAALAVVPIQFCNRYGRRRVLPQEKTACAEFYRAMGTRMNLHEIPASYAEFATYLDNYERLNFAYTDAAHQLMLATTELMEWRFPPRLRRHTPVITSTFMNRPMRTALGVPEPPPGLTTVLRLIYRTANRVQHWRRPHPERRYPDGVVTPLTCYPDGYHIEQIGPQPTAATPTSRQAPTSAP